MVSLGFVVLVCELLACMQYVAVDANNQIGSNQESQDYVNFVVVGATGSLAQKYLWQGLYDLQQQLAKDDVGSISKVAFYGGARADYSNGFKAMKEILENRVDYDDADSKEKFVKAAYYFQLKTCGDYEAFCRGTLDGRGEEDFCEARDENHCGFPTENDGPFTTFRRRESGRIFYLSVPPYSYAELAKCIHRVCRPSNGTSSPVWIRLVLEKPFGTDVATVNSLVASLRSDFSEDEIYLVDHYLGKSGVQEILSLRFSNQYWFEPLLNNNHVEKMEVIIKETEDVKGRLNYYDTYGVFLDVMQNHAMEMLTLAAMHLPHSSDDHDSVVRAKLQFLQSVLPIHPDNIVSGQYSDYIKHGQSQFGREDFTSWTPTFGAVVLQVPTARWRGVPFFMISGKALDAKESSIRITFRNSTVRLLDEHLVSGDLASRNHVKIFVSSQHEPGPWMSISKGIVARESIVTKWQEFSPKAVGQQAQWTYMFKGKDRAYSKVVSDVFFGRRDNFVSMDQLTASWVIWEEYLKKSPTVQSRLYPAGSAADLDVIWTLSGLDFVTDPLRSTEAQSVTVSGDDEDFTSFSLCSGSNLSVIVKPLRSVVEDIVANVLEQITRTVGTFHLAIPGGRTPIPIFRQLFATNRFPWSDVHFWFTDERCISHDHVLSNFYNANHYLFQHAQIPYLNIHPMPVDLASGFCHPRDNGSALYAETLRRHLSSNRSFDVVILGVGADGHVASLFPDASDTAASDDKLCQDVGNNDEWVTLTEAGSGYDVQRRMSLTFKTLRMAKRVFLVITSKDKHNVVKQLKGEGQHLLSSAKFPVRNVGAAQEVRLYIDNDAYYN